jgi:hypothetical protein
MSDYLGRLAQRVIAPRALLQPRLPSLFEGPAAAEPMREEIGESVAMPTVAVPAVTAAPSNVAVSKATAAPPRPVAAVTARDEDTRPPETNEDPRTPVEHIETTAPRALEPRGENDRQQQLVIVREVLETIPMEIAANAHLAPGSGEAPPPPGSTLTPTQQAAPRPRIVTRRAAESRRAAVRETPADAPAQAERDVLITIGRIDVRAVTPPARERSAPKASRTLTLDDYLSQRGRR